MAYKLVVTLEVQDENGNVVRAGGAFPAMTKPIGTPLRTKMDMAQYEDISKAQESLENMHRVIGIGVILSSAK